MKIKIIDASTKKPVINTTIQLQVKGKEKELLSLTTDASGMVKLDDKYNGQQLSSPSSNGQGQSVTACESAVFLLPTKMKSTATH